MRARMHRKKEEKRKKEGKRRKTFFERLGLTEITEMVDLVKRFPMSIWLQKSASIQTRTSLLKSDDHKFYGSQFRSHAERLVGAPCPLKRWHSTQRACRSDFATVNSFVAVLCTKDLWQLPSSSSWILRAAVRLASKQRRG